MVFYYCDLKIKVDNVCVVLMNYFCERFKCKEWVLFFDKDKNDSICCESILVKWLLGLVFEFSNGGSGFGDKYRLVIFWIELFFY